MMRSDSLDGEFIDPLKSWASALRGGSRPRYLQLVDFIEHAVADGLLHPGERVPAQRTLATRLGIDLTTVTRGFMRHAVVG